jgi:hypothetical protein
MSSSRSRAPSPERRLRDFGAPGNGPAPRSKISAARGRYAGSLAQLRESRWRIGTRCAPLRARRIVAACLIRVKPGKSQSEQQISALPPITTVERHPGSRLLPGTIAGNSMWVGAVVGNARRQKTQALQGAQADKSSAQRAVRHLAPKAIKDATAKRQQGSKLTWSTYSCRSCHPS